MNLSNLKIENNKDDFRLFRSELFNKFRDDQNIIYNKFYLNEYRLLYTIVYKYEKKCISEYISPTIFKDHKNGRLIYEKLFIYNVEKHKAEEKFKKSKLPKGKFIWFKFYSFLYVYANYYFDNKDNNQIKLEEIKGGNFFERCINNKLFIKSLEKYNVNNKEFKN